jgi:hypothetical protein
MLDFYRFTMNRGNRSLTALQNFFHRLQLTALLLNTDSNFSQSMNFLIL